MNSFIFSSSELGLRNFVQKFLECFSERFGYNAPLALYLSTREWQKAAAFFNPEVPVTALVFQHWFLIVKTHQTVYCIQTLLFIYLGIFLHLLPSHTVQILEEPAACSWSLELQPCSQMYPLLLLQEHCPLHHWGMSHTVAPKTESHAMIQIWKQSIEIFPHNMIRKRQRSLVGISMFVFLLTGASDCLPDCAAPMWKVGVLTYVDRRHTHRYTVSS